MFKKVGMRFWTFLGCQRDLGLPQVLNFCTVNFSSQKMMQMGTKKAKNPYV